MKKLSWFVLCCAALCVWQMPNTATAQWGGGWGPGAFYGPYLGFPSIWQNSYNGRVPPYFSLHPPVYYSGQIQRIPYGSSPFAAMPGYPAATCPRSTTPAGEVQATPTSEGAMIINPHYKPAPGKTTQSPAPGAPKPESLGVMIENSFYHREVHIAKR